MNYNEYFEKALAELHRERRYRVFADLERIAGRFPHAIWHAPGGPREVVILYDKEGRPTVPARTPYFTCVTGTTLLPGEIPPPPEYCCA